MKVIELLGDKLEHCLNGNETMKWSKKLIMRKGTMKNKGRGFKYRDRVVIMEKEVAKRETGKGSSEYRDRAVIMAMEAAKKQMKEVKETGRGRGSKYNRGKTVIRSRGRGRAVIIAVKTEAERQK